MQYSDWSNILSDVRQIELDFIEPSLRYHSPLDCSIPSIWTDDEPWSISIPIGFRFLW